MNNAGFPVNDLFRRRLQTGLTIATLTLSVASTLFLLLFSNRLGVGIFSVSGVFTLGLTATFGQFILFTGALIFVVGAILTSFIVFLMMAQRTRDFGLIKAAGCPNSLVAGYFMTELLIVTFFGCLLGVFFGFIADFAAANLVFGNYQLPAWWFALLVFVVFLVLAVSFGLQPLLKVTKMSAAQALSAANYYGLIIEGKHKTLPHSALTWRIAARSMVRRLSAISRIVILLSIVFTLLTVSVAGGIIAKDTTNSWIQRTTDDNLIAVAHTNMGNQYRLLLSSFSGDKITGDFNYSDPKLAIPNSVSDRLNALPRVNSVNVRLVLYEKVKEISNFTVIDGKETYVGDSRKGECIVIGLNPQKMDSDWTMKGRCLGPNSTLEAVIGDSISQTMYTEPLVERIEFENTTFRIVGVGVDAINNGRVTYVPIDKMMNVTGVNSPNLLLVTLKDSVDRDATISEIRGIVKGIDSDLDVVDLSGVAEQNTAFLGSTWQTIMLLPLLTLISATLCLVGYMMLAVDEQRQEFAMLRAVGAKPRIITSISAIQSAIVLFSSFGIGISFGVITTLMILMANPLVTSTTIAVISIWLTATLFSMFLLSLYPAFKLAKMPILKIMS